MPRPAKPILVDHTRKGKLLVPPLVKLGVQLTDWAGEYLPEHLWLAYLIRGRSVSLAAAIFNSACDIVDDFFEPVGKGHVFLGYLSDFAFIPAERQPQLLTALEADDVASPSVGADFRRVLGLYPVGPGQWLALRPDADSLPLLRELVSLLREQKIGKAAQCRMLGLNRLFKHQLFLLSRNAADGELLKGLQQYPNTDDEVSRRVEQFARIAMNVTLQMHPRTGWAPGFWVANLTMVNCA